MYNPAIIIPTYNEVSNISILIENIYKFYPDMNIIIIDGKSTDGTIEAVKEKQKTYPKLYLKIHAEEKGYGDALSFGFNIALNKKFDPILTMDGDRSHDPAYIKYFLALYEQYDVILGSRYINGVRVEGWQFRKLLLSKFANMYISYILVRPIWDFTSGFRLYRRRFLESINLDKLENKAYIFQIQLIYLAYQNRFHVKEIPFVFRDRYPGKSKIGAHSKIKTFLYVLRYRAPFFEILRHLTYLKKDYKRFVAEYEELVNPPIIRDRKNFEVKDSYDISIGVMAYNEEKLIGKCLNALLGQKLEKSVIKEIIVVSSGSIDKTDEIVRKIAEKDSRIRLIVQPERRGKANAINEFLSIASGDIVVIESADTVTEPDTVQKLIVPFRDRKIGMTGVHPIPVNAKKGFIGFAVHKLWELHHMMALDNPKCGEMVALRNVLAKIPNYTAVDEAVIEAMIAQTGLKNAYAPEAILHNKGPETIKDFIKQRRRIASGHLHLCNTMGYEVATNNPKRIFSYLKKSQKWNIKDIIYMILLMILELYSRIAGKIDYNFRDKNPFIWDISKSTKRM